MSLHPPHLINSNGSLTPAGLIPFCAYQTNMTLLGQTRQDLPFTVCSHFKPTVLEGQLCYSLDLSSIKTENSKPGERAGLFILIDQGVADEESETNINTQEKTEQIRDIDLKGPEQHENYARIYLNTLTSFTDNRAGSYALSSLKKITGTDGFLEQTDAQKNCRTETLEDCQSRY